jgi:hypothetical protein
VLNVGNSKSRFFRLISTKDGNLFYQTPSSSNDSWGTRKTLLDSTNYNTLALPLTGGNVAG